MTRIIADISVSPDGSVTEPDPSPDNGLGTGIDRDAPDLRRLPVIR